MEIMHNVALFYAAGVFILGYDLAAPTSFSEVMMSTPFFTMNDLQRNIFKVINTLYRNP